MDAPLELRKLCSGKTYQWVRSSVIIFKSVIRLVVVWCRDLALIRDWSSKVLEKKHCTPQRTCACRARRYPAIHRGKRIACLRLYFHHYGESPPIGHVYWRELKVKPDHQLGASGTEHCGVFPQGNSEAFLSAACLIPNSIPSTTETAKELINSEEVEEKKNGER